MMKIFTLQSTIRAFTAVGVWMMTSSAAVASPAEVLKVSASQNADNSWSFQVTLNHDDTGWDHYANAWDVSNQDGEIVYGKRVLHHPHVNEMPFTRGLSGVMLPAETERVWIRAYDNLSDTPGEAF